ncbi:MAG: transcriptional repressor [Clostridiales bacterium]|nr:transcriptional repressor [Clostridiales bacterium]
MRTEYSTRQKRELMAFLENHDMKNFSLDEIVFSLQGAGAQIGRTTVYRTLEALAEAGSVRKYQNAQGITQYQHVADASRCESHFHLLCKQCGQLYHVDCDFTDTLAKHILAHHGFRLDSSQTMLVGVCAKCAGLEEDRDGVDHDQPCDHGV